MEISDGVAPTDDGVAATDVGGMDVSGADVEPNGGPPGAVVELSLAVDAHPAIPVVAASTQAASRPPRRLTRVISTTLLSVAGWPIGQSDAARPARLALPSVELTHVDASGEARMVDVSGKDVTAREAVASGRLVTTPEVITLLHRDGLPKGDALAVARIAGIAGAKRTPDLVPLCHPVALHAVSVDLQLTETAVEITATTRTADRTGIEMEAMTAVVVAGLALYDMVKAVDRAAVLTDVRLVAKSGGRSGSWRWGDA